MNREGEQTRSFRSGDGPGVTLWYDFRQRLPPGDHGASYAEWLEEIEEGERLVFTGARLSEHHFVDDAAVAARTSTKAAPRVREAVEPKPS